VSLARPDGGRVALVLPQSILASRDTAPVRAAVVEQAALVGLWWAGEPIFDAQVSVCIVVLRRGVPQREVRRWRGRDLRSLPAAPASALAGRTWSPLIADVAGVPAVAMYTGIARLRDVASATAGFRHQYYGLVEHVRDDGPGAPLVTAGLIDAGRCRWGTAPARFAKRRFRAPRVDVDSLEAADPALGRWVRERLMPKVLVATQTRVIEAVADPEGAWVPSVPVVAVHPRRVEDVWSVAAVLTAPPVAAWAATHHLGTGLGPTALKLSATQVLDLPLPRRSWDGAADLLRAGDVHGCAEAMCDAYEVTEPHREPLMAWWRSATARSCPSDSGGRPACL
jgi:hypothetical protein